MAQNYEDVVGVLKLKQVTPVIRALFSCYNLDETYPGKGEVYIARSENAPQDTTWGAMLPDLKLLCKWLGLTFPTFEEDEFGISEASFGVSFPQIFVSLFNHFGQSSHPLAGDYINFLATVESYDIPEIKVLYELAMLMNDGHGLESYQVDAAWHSSRLGLYDFGGWGEYQSPNYFLYSSSTAAGKDGPLISQALANERYDQAATHVLQATDRMLFGITPPATRRQVAREMVNQLNNIYNSNLATDPASNEPIPSNPYEAVSVLIYPDEACDEIAHSMCNIARRWADAPDVADNYQRITGAMGEFVQLLEEGNGATIPPMHLYPVNPHNQIYDPIVYRDSEMEKGRWDFNQPIPLTDPVTGTSLSKSFEEISNALEQHRIDAAKKMFGT